MQAREVSHSQPSSHINTPIKQALEALKGPARLLRKGDHAYRSGEALHSLYLVRSGAIKTYRICEDGEEQVVGFYGPGDVIGFDAIAARRFVCSAVALDTSSVYPLSFDLVMKRSDESLGVWRELMRGMSREVARLEGMSLMLGKKSADQRVAAFLLSQSEGQQRHGYCPTVFVLKMSRTDIGRYAGLAVETVCRILSRFQSEGLLSAERNRITLHDVERLRQVAA